MTQTTLPPARSAQDLPAAQAASAIAAAGTATVNTDLFLQWLVDTRGVRARTTAHWLRQRGHDIAWLHHPAPGPDHPQGARA